MNLNMNQHQTSITAPDDSAKLRREAIPPAGQTEIVIPRRTADATGAPPLGRSAPAQRGKLYGMSLAWRGLRVVGVTFAIAAVWFVGAWVRYGRIPLGLNEPTIRPAPAPILPPVWLLAILGLLVVISICMILSGTQDVVPKLKFTNGRQPNKTHGNVT